jgi:hypothetical protein
MTDVTDETRRSAVRDADGYMLFFGRRRSAGFN